MMLHKQKLITIEYLIEKRRREEQGREIQVGSKEEKRMVVR